MSVLGALAGGVIGTAVLTTLLRTASELGLTRVDLPFLLGTAVTDDRARAKAIGYLAHFGFGMLFAFAYALIFLAIERSGWLIGGALGLVHGLFAATALVNVLLPVVHPRMGKTWSDAGSSPFVEPPGFLMLNYGPGTPLVSTIAHVVYGAIVGGFAAWGG
ncbi:MAG TPA: hypothetical protein VFZ75_00190 [Actinomycetota bacterium]|nr:hypothetical protein [Actinomycetota bacterium]